MPPEDPEQLLQQLQPEEPYPGLRSYATDERMIFFGRDAQVTFMAERLEAEHFLCITGPSGCGKSSLARTGLISGLRAGLAHAGTDWVVIDTHPANDPFQQLTRAIETVLAPDLGKALQGGADQPGIDLSAVLASSLQRTQFDLCKVLSMFSMFQGRPILLLIDQFEELFGYAREEPERASSFIRMMLEAMRPAHGIDIHVAITIRADSLDACARYDGLAEAINRGQFLTPALSREELSEIIQGPIALFDGDADPAFVGWLLNEMAHEPDRLPLLQHALKILWADEKARIETGRHDTGQPHLNRADFRRNFGAAEARATARGDALRFALSDRLDAAYEALPERLQPLARKIFCALVEMFSGDRDIKRRLTIRQLVAATGAPRDDVVAVLDLFRGPERQYLHPGIGERPVLSDDTTIRVMHECLFRQWRQFRLVWLRDYELAIVELQFLARSALHHATQNGPHFGPTQLRHYQDWFDKNRPTRAWGSPFLKALDWVEEGRRLSPGEIYDRSLDFLVLSDRLESEADEQKRRDARRRRALIGSALVVGSLATAVPSLIWYQHQRDLQITEVVTGEVTEKVTNEVALVERVQALERQGATEAELNRYTGVCDPAVGSEVAARADGYAGAATTPGCPEPKVIASADSIPPATDMPVADDAAESDDVPAPFIMGRDRSILEQDPVDAPAEVTASLDAKQIGEDPAPVIPPSQNTVTVIEVNPEPEIPPPFDTATVIEETPMLMAAALDGRLLNCDNDEVAQALNQVSLSAWIDPPDETVCQPVADRPVLADIPLDAIDSFDAGYAALNRGRFDDALTRFRDADRTAPNVPRLYRYLGWTLVSKVPADPAAAWMCFRHAVEQACNIAPGMPRDEQLLWGWSNLTVVPDSAGATAIAAAAWAQKGLHYMQNTAYPAAQLGAELQHPYRKFEAFLNAAKGFAEVGSCGGETPDPRVCAASADYYRRAQEQLLAFTAMYAAKARPLQKADRNLLNSAAWDWAADDLLRGKDSDGRLATFFLSEIGTAVALDGTQTPGAYVTLSLLKCQAGDLDGAIGAIVNWPAASLASRRALAEQCMTKAVGKSADEGAATLTAKD